MEATVLVLEEIAAAAGVRAPYNPALHPRMLKGRRGGGEFASKLGTVRRERDVVGEFTAARGGFQSRLDRHLVDYERKGASGARAPGDPGRTLSNRHDVEAVGRLLHGARHVGYSETPFFAKLERLQGTRNPSRETGLQNEAQRNALFDRQPLRRVPLDPSKIVFTQPNVNAGAIAHVKSAPTDDAHPAYVVRHGGLYYVMDGHHRMLAAAARHETSYPARVLTIR